MRKISLVLKLASVLLLMLSGNLLSARPQPPESLPEPEREFRAVWIATIDNIDFPSRKGLPPEEQKAELLADLELARSLRLNAVVFQVRPMADAVYRPGLEPWSEFLTGEMGKPQDFDPLDFLVTEAHKRGILVHAWFNPYRAYHPAAKTMSALHVSKQHPEFVREYGRYLWLDPTDDNAKQYSLNVILDVVRRYDIDGVHFDDYFYPYAERDASGQKIDFPDDANWKKYREQIGSANETAPKERAPMDRGDWRRWHVNSFIQAVGREIKRVKPEIVYGISPFGIWQPVPEKGIEGFNAAAELYADSRKWLQDGTVDYLSPQLYWETARAGLSFPVLLDWWEAQNVRHRYIWPGIASYRIGSTKTFTAAEIASQVEATRKSPDSRGAIHFSFRSLRNDMGGIQAVLRDKVYTRDAIIPQFSWIKVEKISPPKVSVTRDAQFVRANWTEQGNRRAFWFVVYARDRNGWTYSVLPASVTSIALSADRKIEEIVVSSVDRLGNESQSGRR